MATQVSMFKATATLPHLHVLGDVCPLCEQPIPHDRFDEIKARIETRERDHVNQVARALEKQFADEKRQMEEQAARDTEQKVAAARVLARQEAEETGKEKLNAAEEARRLAERSLEQTKADAVIKEAEIRADATRAAQAGVQQQLKEQQEARIAAELKATSAEKQLGEKEQAFKDQLAQQREALEIDKAAAVNGEKAAAYKERLKWHEKVQSLERALEKKSNEELGEGAEVNLYDALKAEFTEDRIERIVKGQPGADIRHVVVHNGRSCGTILYDSKNHAAWRNDFVKKLATDQMAEGAEHAVLSTCAFPAGVRQVHMQGGVIIANPARVCALVQILRQHIVRTSTLRLSGESRAQKTATLYEFITSERCGNLLNKIDEVAEELLDLQVKERKAHEQTWTREGVLLRTIQKSRAELCTQIDNIVSEPVQ